VKIFVYQKIAENHQKEKGENNLKDAYTSQNLTKLKFTHMHKIGALVDVRKRISRSSSHCSNPSVGV